MIENENRISSLSLLLEARHELRTHLALETALIELIAELPEDDFCHEARESMSLGAGYAYRRRETGDPEDLGHVYEAFFATQPRSRYLDPEEVRARQQPVIDAALEHLDDHNFGQLDAVINQYTVEALVAFIDGFMVTREYFMAQDYTSPTPAAESA